jgi:hypothetical protein
MVKILNLPLKHKRSVTTFKTLPNSAQKYHKTTQHITAYVSFLKEK